MSVLDLDAAKAYLRITSDAHDDELPGFIEAAEGLVARRVGPLEPVSVTEKVRGGRASVVLTKIPAISVDTMTDQNGTAVVVGDLAVDPSGVVEFANGLTRFCATSYTVTYTAGYDALPGDLLIAVKETLRHLWMSQRGSGTRPGSPPSTELSNTLPGAAYALPIRVQQLIDPYVAI